MHRFILLFSAILSLALPNNLSFGFASLEFDRSFCEFSSFFAQIYDPSDIFCAKKEKPSSKISMYFEESEPKTQVIKLVTRKILLS